MDSVTVAKFLFTASVNVFSSWLSQKRPKLAGFIIALPLASLLALALAHLKHGDAQKSIAYCIYISKYNHRCHQPSTARIIKDQEEKRT